MEFKHCEQPVILLEAGKGAQLGNCIMEALHLCFAERREVRLIFNHHTLTCNPNTIAGQIAAQVENFKRTEG